MHGFFTFIFIFFFSSVFSQKQLVVLHHNQVIARFTEGDYFNCVLESGLKKEGYIFVLNEFSMVTSAYDTIPFISIRKIKTKKTKMRKLGGVGAMLLFSGIGYITLDQVNSLYGSTQGKFDGAYTIALSMAGAGAALLFIRPKYKKIKRGMVIRSTDYRTHY
ncbi:MAG: hypothetical protein ACKO96_28040 [Flammeovirgaceae bacterium]